MLLSVVVECLMVGTMFANKGTDAFATDVVGKHHIRCTVSVERGGLFIIVGMAHDDCFWINSVNVVDKLLISGEISNRTDNQLGMFDTNFTE